MEDVSQASMVARAVRGDEAAFAALIEPHRRQVFRHCYRMLGSGMDAEDATQDTLERAWRRLATFSAAGEFGGWLHRIATNVCLDLLRSRRPRRDPTGEGRSAEPGAFRGLVDADHSWVEPVSDLELGSNGDPQAEILRREDISLAFVAALQRLPPRQRAALLLSDVIGFTQGEVAEVLDVTPTAVNSLLSRARQTVRSRSSLPRVDRSDPRVRDLLDRYVRAWHMADIDALVELITDDVRFTMPPMSEWFEGRDTVAAFVDHAVFAPSRPSGIPLRLGWCNGQPAFATYQPDGEQLVVSGLQIVELASVDGQMAVAAIVSYRDGSLAIRCGLPPTVS